MDRVWRKPFGVVSYANAEEGIRVVSDQSSVCKSFCVKPVYSSLLCVFAIVLSFLVAKEKEKKKKERKCFKRKIWQDVLDTLIFFIEAFNEVFKKLNEVNAITRQESWIAFKLGNP